MQFDKRENAEQFWHLIQNSIDMICVLDKNEILRFIFPAAQNLLGYEAQQLEGKPFTSLVHSADLPAISKSWATLLESPDEA